MLSASSSPMAALARHGAKESWLRSRVRWLLPVALLAAFPVWVVAGFPWLDYLELNPDEGINLAKASLVAAGYRLYAQVWSDQPPLLTHLLAALQRVRPWDVLAARELVLVFACLLLASLFRLVDQRDGRRAALWAVLLLGTAPLFVRLSVSVMVGLPAIAVAVLAWAVAGQHRLPRPVTAVLSGLLLALSLQTKLFTVSLAPAIVATLWLNTMERERWRSALVFAGACGLGVLGIGLLTGATSLDQLVAPHFSPQLRADHSLGESADMVWQVLKGQPVLVAFGTLGALLAGRRLSASHLPVALALLVPGALLLMHAPVWYHQVLLLLPAMAWLGGLALARLVREAGGRRGAAGPLAAGACALLAAGTAAGLALSSGAPEADRSVKQTTVEALRRYAGLGGWVVTDSPLDAFRAGLLVPPELAVYSAKRIKVGRLSPATVLDTIRDRQARQVLFRRFPPDPSLIAHLDSHYLPSHRGPRFSHYVNPVEAAPDLAPQAVRSVLDPMLREFAATAVRGGYAGIVSADGRRYGETTATVLGPDSTYMRPPGSTPAWGPASSVRTRPRAMPGTGNGRARPRRPWCARSTARAPGNGRPRTGRPAPAARWTRTARSRSTRGWSPRGSVSCSTSTRRRPATTPRCCRRPGRRWTSWWPRRTSTVPGHTTSPGRATVLTRPSTTT